MLDGNYVVNLDVDVVIASLTLGGPVGEQVLTNFNRTLTLATNSVVNSNGVLALAGGGLTGAGNLAFHGLLSWTGGTISGNINQPWSTTIEPDGRLMVGGTATKFLTSRILNNAGTAVWTNTGNIQAQYGAVFNNSGSLEALSDAKFIDPTSVSSPKWTLFRNGGSFNKMGGTNITQFSEILFTNMTGSFGLQTGTLELKGCRGTLASVVLAAPATLRLTSGTFELPPGATILGDGTVRLTGAVLNCNSPVNFNGTLDLSSGTANFNEASGVNTVSFSGGNLGGTNFLTITNLTWTGGAMTGGGGSAITAAGTLLISGSSTKSLVARTFHNAGVGTWTGGGKITGIQGSVFNNSGSFEAQGDGSFEWGNSGNRPTFNNSGSFKKTGGANVTRFLNTPFYNTGTVEAMMGLVSFDGGYSQARGGTRLDGGNIGATTNFNILGGELSGYGNIFANVENRGEVNPGSALGVLTIHSNFTHSGRLNFELGGLVPGTQHDQINVVGTANLGGSLSVCLAPGFRPISGDSFQVLRFGAQTGSFAASYGLDLGAGTYLTPLVTLSNLMLVAANGPTNLLTLTLVPCGQGAYQVHFTGEPDQNYSIQASTYLTNDWVTLITTNSALGVIDFLDVDAPSFTKRYYRAAEMP